MGRLITDSLTARRTFVDVFDIIVIPKDKGQIMESFVVAGRLTEVAPGSATVEVSVVNPRNIIHATQVLTGQNLAGGDVDLTANFVLSFTEPGLYWFQVKYNGVVLAGGNNHHIAVRTGA